LGPLGAGRLGAMLCDWHIIEITVLCIVVVICCRSSSRDVTVGLCRRSALSHVVVYVIVIPSHRCISSLLVLSHDASLTYSDVALRRALLRLVVIVSCHFTSQEFCFSYYPVVPGTLSSSSDKADHCFLSKCLDEFAIRN